MFKITVPIHECGITKSINADGEEVTKRRILGIASGTELDRDEEEFALSALKAMQRAIEEGITLPDGTHSLVPLQSDHKQSWLTDLGFLTKAWVEEGDENYNLWIEAELNDSPSADYFYKLLTQKNEEKGRPTKLGLSIGGLVTKAHRRINQATKKMNLVFEHILLKEVSVVSQPAYPTQYLQALSKSYQQKEDEEMSQKELVEETSENTEVEATKNEAVTTEPTKETVTKEEVEEHSEGEVTKSEVSPQEFAEIKEGLGNVTKAVADIADILNQMKANYASLSIGFEANRDENGAIVDSTKSQDETEAVDNTVEVVRKGLNEAFVLYTDQAIKPLIKMISELKAEVSALASTPIDKSMSVNAAETLAAQTPKDSYARRKALAQEKNMPFDPIKAAVEAAFLDQE